MIQFSSSASTRGVSRLFVTFLLALSISGCALLVPHRKPVVFKEDDPLVRACARAVGGIDASLLAAPKKNSEPPSGGQATLLLERTASQVANGDVLGAADPVRVGTEICGGYLRAEGYRQAYFDAVRWNSGFRTTAAALSIPLVGLTVREGLESSPSNDKIADFSVASIVLYGWATVLTSAPRQKAYLNGMQAMSCAMLEAQPLIVGASQLQVLDKRVDAVEAARKVLYEAISRLPDPSLTRPTDVFYVRALADAHAAIVRANEFAVEIARASGEFTPLVEMIATEVGRNIVDTEPSPQSLLSLLNSFGAQTRLVAQGLLPDKKTDSAGVQESASAAEGAAQEALRKLRVAIDELNDALEKVVAVSASTANIKACKPASAVNEFKVEPGAAAVVIEQDKSHEFVVINKVSVPSAQLEGDNTDTVELEAILVRGDNFVVRIKGKSPTGAAGPTLVIKDGTGQQAKRIAVSVTPKPGAPGKTPPASDGAPTPAPAAADENPALTDEETELLVNAALAAEGADPAQTVRNSVKVLQCVVGTSVDGDMGKQTRDAIEAFRQSKPEHPRAIDQLLIDEVRTALNGQRKSCKEQA